MGINSWQKQGGELPDLITEASEQRRLKWYLWPWKVILEGHQQGTIHTQLQEPEPSQPSRRFSDKELGYIINQRIILMDRERPSGTAACSRDFRNDGKPAQWVEKRPFGCCLFLLFQSPLRLFCSKLVSSAWCPCDCLNSLYGECLHRASQRQYLNSSTHSYFTLLPPLHHPCALVPLSSK